MAWDRGQHGCRSSAGTTAPSSARAESENKLQVALLFFFLPCLSPPPLGSRTCPFSFVFRPQAGCTLGLRRPPGTAAPGGVGAGARYLEQRFVRGHRPRPSSKTFPFLSVVPTCRLITPAQPAFPLAAATVSAGRPPLRKPACCGLLSPAPGLLAGSVGPCGARRGAASPRGVRR